MKVKIIVDVDLANDALAALASYAASLAKHAKAHPGSAFEWARHTREANDKTEAFRKAIGNAEVASLD